MSTSHPTTRLQRVGTWLLAVVAIAACAVFSGVPWFRSERALYRASQNEEALLLAQHRATIADGRLVAVEQRLASLEAGEVGRVPQVLRYEAHGDLVDIVVETMMWPDETHASWVARQNAAWSAVGVQQPAPPAGGK